VTVPVVILTYNRPDFLSKVLAEHNRVNTPKPIFIFDDGSADVSIIKSLTSNPDYVCIQTRHLNYRNQFCEIGNLFNKLGYKYFMFTEDDASFSINWYQWAMCSLDKLETMYDVGAFSLYSGHNKPNGKKVLPYVYKHVDDHFYGTCGIIVNTKYIEGIKEIMFSDNSCKNPDVAIRKMSINKNLNLFVTFPNIVQHEGVGKSLVLAPQHHSETFLGNNRDAMKELL